MSYGSGDCVCTPAFGEGAYRYEAHIRRDCLVHGEHREVYAAIVDERDRYREALEAMARDYLESEANYDADPGPMIEGYLDRAAAEQGNDE